MGMLTSMDYSSVAMDTSCAHNRRYQVYGAVVSDAVLISLRMGIKQHRALIT